MAKKKLPSKKSPLKIYILNATLEATSPVVWRKLMVDGSFSLEALHSVLQLVFGWQMSHLYEFQIGKTRYSMPDDDSSFQIEDVDIEIQDAVGTEDHFFYNFEFGDGWRHKVNVEAVVQANDIFQYPIRVDGANACPPEDCGGAPGFANLKEAISNPEHPEHDEILRWLGGYYNPYSFDANRINRDLLSSIDWRKQPNDQGLYLPFQDV